jgi:NAD(P)H-nitrite reductase large subunit
MIFVNRKMETNIPKIFAAGDVALCYEISGEGSRCLPRWYRAWKQGEVAGLNMVGIETDYEEIPICAASTKIAGIPLLCLGNPNPSEPAAKILLGMDRDKGIYKKIVLRNNQIDGALFIGDVRRGAKVAQLMRQASPITDSEQAFIQELVRVSGDESDIAITICPICKMEISSAGCPACGQ